jgi:carbon-monoxide dehydrogenase medium subunit
MLTEIRVPKMQVRVGIPEVQPPRAGLGDRRCRCVKRNGESGVGLVNMGSVPILATSVSSALAGGASASDAAESAAAEADPQAT